LEITATNTVPSENILAGTVFPGEPRGTYFIARISTESLLFWQLILKKYRSPGNG
jgi:hypothetical protein